VYIVVLCKNSLADPNFIDCVHIQHWCVPFKFRRFKLSVSVLFIGIPTSLCGLAACIAVRCLDPQLTKASTSIYRSMCRWILSSIFFSSLCVRLPILFYLRLLTVSQLDVVSTPTSYRMLRTLTGIRVYTNTLLGAIEHKNIHPVSWLRNTKFSAGLLKSVPV
jgi:hypothetical protein